MSEKKPTPPYRLFIAVFLVMVGLFSAIQLWRHRHRPVTPPTDDPLLGIALAEPKPINPFQLVDQDRQPFNPERLRGKWSFLFFGYTHCPDVCPLHLSILAQVYERLQETAPELLTDSRVWFISVDPARDTPERLKGYVSYYHTDFMAATGTPEALRDFAKSLHAIYELSTDVDENGNYDVSHSSAIHLVDPKGRFHALFQSQFQDPDQIVKSFIKIRKRW